MPRELRARQRRRQRRVFAAAAAAGVPALVHASSVGVVLARTQGPRGRRVLADGRHAVLVLRAPQGRGRAPPGCVRGRAPRVRVVRLRPGLIFKREAATGDPAPVRRPAAARRARAAGLLPVLPLPRGLRMQACTATTSPTPTGSPSCDDERPRRLQRRRRPGDRRRRPRPPASARGRCEVRAVGAARRRAGAPGACGCRRRRRAGWTWASPSRRWTAAARASELGWRPIRSSVEALEDSCAGMREHADAPTPPLAPRARGPLRLRELPRRATAVRAVAVTPRCAPRRVAAAMKAVTWQGTRDVRVDTVPDPMIEHPTDAIIASRRPASAVRTCTSTRCSGRSSTPATCSATSRWASSRRSARRSPTSRPATAS